MIEPLDGTDAWKSEYETIGYHELRATVARKLIIEKIYPHDLEEFAAFDTSPVWDKFPAHVDVLTLHGLVDQNVPT
jgi:hypothetical protein